MKHGMVVNYAAKHWLIRCSGCDWQHEEVATFSGLKAGEMVRLYKAHSPDVVTVMPEPSDNPVRIGKLG